MGGKDIGLRNSVFQGFQHVKNDIERVTIRMMLLESENNRLKQELEELRRERISEKNNQISGSQPIIETETLRILLRQIVSEELKSQNTKAAAIFSAETEQKNNPHPQNDKLKEDLLRSYERNRRNIIKQHILTEASRGSHTKIQLRDIVVDQKKYCSKASFYRYLEELEFSGTITYQRHKNKAVITPLAVTNQ